MVINTVDSLRAPTTIGAVLDHAAESFPDRCALVVDDRSITFEELQRRARLLAGALERSGVGAGDHVACWLPNSLEFVECLYAVAHLGAVLVPINTWFTQREFEYVLQQSDSKALISVDQWNQADYRAVVEGVLGPPDSRPGNRRIPVAYVGDTGAADGYEQLLQSGGEGPKNARCSADSPSLLLYTSGTTARPKGALLDHSGVTRDAALLGERIGLRTDSRYFCPAPFFHAGGLVFCLLAGHLRGAAVVSIGRFSADAAVEQVVANRCDAAGGFDIMYRRMLEVCGDGQELPLEVGWWATGSSTLFREVEAGLNMRLINLYGLTEASGNVTCTPSHWPLSTRSRSQGIPLAGREVTIVDPTTGSALAAGETGEIRVGGWGLMRGYYKKPDETAAAFDEDGRLRTGDLGVLDEDGRLQFVGRLRDSLKVGGENVAPSEIEDVLLQHSAVAEVAVVGARDAEYGEIPVAFVVVAAGASTSEDELRSWARARLSSFKLPRRVLFRRSFSRTSTGKIRKAELSQELATDGTL